MDHKAKTILPGLLFLIDLNTRKIENTNQRICCYVDTTVNPPRFILNTFLGLEQDCGLTPCI